MRLLRHISFWTAITLTVYLASCGGPPVMTEENRSEFDQVVARGDGVLITAQDLFDRLQREKIVGRGGEVPPGVIQKYLDSMLLDTLTGLYASTVDIGKYYYDYWTYKLRYHDFLIPAFFNEQFLYKIDVDSSEVKDFYEEYKDQFHMPEQVELSHILVSPKSLLAGEDSTYYKSLSEDDFARAVKDRAYELYDMIQTGMPFGDVARQYSHDALSNKKYGYVGWTTRGTYIDPFDSVAFSLDVGEVSEPYQDQDGWHIITIDDYVEGGPAPLDRDGVFDKAKDALLQQKVAEERAVLMDSLYRELDLEFNEALIDSNVYLVDDSVWAAVVNGRDTIDFRYLKNAEENFRRRFGVDATSGDLRRGMITSIAQRFVIVETAEDLGIDTLEYVVKERRQLRHLTAKSILEDQHYDPLYRPTDSAVEQYYNDHIDQYVFKKPFVVKELVVNDSVVADYLRDQARSGYDFEELPNDPVFENKQFTVTLKNPGRIGPGDLDSALYRAVERTAAGSVSLPARGPDGKYHLFEIAERHDSKTLSQVHGSIVSDLTMEYRIQSTREALQKLIDYYNVEFPYTLRRVHLKPWAQRVK